MIAPKVLVTGLRALFPAEMAAREICVLVNGSRATITHWPPGLTRPSDEEIEAAAVGFRNVPADPLAAGATIGGVTYAIDDAAQMQWTAALTALDNASALGLDLSAVPVESLLGPILNINGQPVSSMTVPEFRQLMLKLTKAIAASRTP